MRMNQAAPNVLNWELDSGTELSYTLNMRHPSQGNEPGDATNDLSSPTRSPYFVVFGVHIAINCEVPTMNIKQE